MKDASEKYINAKVLAGFGLLFALALLAFAINYVGIVNISKASADDDPLSGQMTILSKLVFQLQESEGMGRLYSMGGEEKHKITYQQLNDSVDATLVHLNNVFNDSLFANQLDTIRHLISEKRAQMEQLIELRSIDRQRKKYGEVLSIPPDSVAFEVNRVINTSLKVDSTKQQKPATESKSFLSRLGLGKKTETSPLDKVPKVVEQRDTGTVQSMRQTHALKQMRDEVAKINRRDQRFDAIVREQEAQLVRMGDHVQSKMRQVVRLMEKKAIQKSNERARHINQLEATLQKRMVLMGISALCIILLFVVWISRDIRKSRQLKDKLLQSSQSIERLAKVKEQFVANMSHEIRTPLTSIIGYSERIKNQAPEAEIIHGSALHLLSLVNNVLDYSLLGSGNINLINEEVDIVAFMYETCRPLQRKAEEKQLELLYNHFGDDTVVNIDKTRLRQLVMNLVNNAIKFTHHGKIGVFSGVKEGVLRIEVKDTGIGLTPKDVALVFDEFKQINPDGKSEGSGLGLAICKQMVTAMGGQIGVNSRLEEGSVFWFEIPVKTGTSIKANQSVVSVNLSDLSILAVDDDPLIINLIEGFLTEKAKHIETAESPYKAIELAARIHYDIVICDYRMPGMNGKEFALRLRQELKLNMPVLFLSAGIGDDLIDLVNTQKGIFLMSKPFTSNDLMSKLAHIIQSSTAGKAIEAEKETPLINIAGIRAFTGDDDVFFKAMIDKFVEQTRMNLQTLSAFIDTEHYAETRELAHKMISGFGQFGITQGVTILKAMEALTKSDGNDRELKASFKRLTKLWKKVEPQLFYNVVV